ncbi:hypothetical protein ACUH95_05550 [Dermabacteraceae bacterium P13101]
MLARANYRDWDGHVRQVQATASTASAAIRKLKAKLADRCLFQPTFTSLTPDSPLNDLVAYWLEDIELEDRLSKTTRNLYERNIRTLVLPVLGHLTLRKLGGCPLRSLPEAARQAVLQPSKASAGGASPGSGIGGASRSPAT